jgi:hypothetical protein
MDTATAARRLCARGSSGARTPCRNRPQTRAVAAAADSRAPPTAGAAAAGAAAAPLALGRRQLLSSAAGAGLAGLAVGCDLSLHSGVAAPPAEALELAPLGQVERVGGDKLEGLSPEQVMASYTSPPPVDAAAALSWPGPPSGRLPPLASASPAVQLSVAAGARLPGACRLGADCGGALPSCSALRAVAAGHPGTQPAGGAVLHHRRLDSGNLQRRLRVPGPHQ